jgi:hypothetical protein
VVAKIAFDQLQPAARTKIVAALKEHPAFKNGLWSGLIEAGADEAASLFLFAAVFPDDIRKDQGPFAEFHDLSDPPAHYVNLPFIPSVADRGDPRIRVSEPNQGQNIFKAFRHHVQEIKSSDASKEDKAISLCWVFHLVGDIHQPLHSAEMYSLTFRTGDQGGNRIKLNPPVEDQLDLHALWDALPGEKHTFKDVSTKALQVTASYAPGDFDLTKETLEEWATESFGLARSTAYNQIPTTSRSLAALPGGYLPAAHKVGDQRVAVAGYRLARVLEELADRLSSGH